MIFTFVYILKDTNANMIAMNMEPTMTRTRLLLYGCSKFGVTPSGPLAAGRVLSRMEFVGITIVQAQL